MALGQRRPRQARRPRAGSAGSALRLPLVRPRSPRLVALGQQRPRQARRQRSPRLVALGQRRPLGARRPRAGSAGSAVGVLLVIPQILWFGLGRLTLCLCVFAAASGSGFGAATQGFGGFGKAASSMGSTASGAAAGHTGEAYARFRREAQRWDFASANVRRPPSDGLESALVKALEVALAQNQRPANSAGNHITAQRLELLGFGVARNAAVAGMPATVGFGQPMSGAGFGGAAGMGTVGNRSRYHGLDDHDEDNQVFDWPIRPNAATEYRHIFYQPISRKECQERNALNGHPAVHDEAHTPNDLRPVDVDDHMWQQALLNKPQNPE
eukprot:COSAG02_NODE_144_length_34086_cov_65.390944_15_plen_327_part_00